MAFDYHVLDVFTRQALSGNPLAVVMGAESLSGVRMQAIAREFNLSETVFLLPPQSADAHFRLRIFTPAHEMPFAGHPTIGTACLLAELGLARGEWLKLEEEAGLVPVRLRQEASQPWFAQLTAPQAFAYGEATPSVERIAAALGLSADDIETDADAPRIASCGVPYLLVPLRSREALARAQLRFGADVGRAVYLYCRGETETLHARMFAAGLGVNEDPATGSAAVALSGHLASAASQREGTLAWTIEQGYEMQRPSQLYIEADKQACRVTAVRVGGYSLRVSHARLLID